MTSLLDMSLDDIVNKGKQFGKKKDSEFYEGYRFRGNNNISRYSRSSYMKRRGNDRLRDISGKSYGRGNRRERGTLSAAFNRNFNYRISRNKFYRRPRNLVVKVSNLDYSILQEDLYELFASVGEVAKVWIDYDRTDRSEGTGGCIFRDPSNARRAVELYNGRIIEGMAIKMEIINPGESTRANKVEAR